MKLSGDDGIAEAEGGEPGATAKSRLEVSQSHAMAMVMARLEAKLSRAEGDGVAEAS